MADFSLNFNGASSITVTNSSIDSNEKIIPVYPLNLTNGDKLEVNPVFPSTVNSSSKLIIEACSDYNFNASNTVKRTYTGLTSYNNSSNKFVIDFTLSDSNGQNPLVDTIRGTFYKVTLEISSSETLATDTTFKINKLPTSSNNINISINNNYISNDYGEKDTNGDVKSSFLAEKDSSTNIITLNEKCSGDSISINIPSLLDYETNERSNISYYLYYQYCTNSSFNNNVSEWTRLTNSNGIAIGFSNPTNESSYNIMNLSEKDEYNNLIYEYGIYSFIKQGGYYRFAIVPTETNIDIGNIDDIICISNIIYNKTKETYKKAVNNGDIPIEQNNFYISSNETDEYNYPLYAETFKPEFFIGGDDELMYTTEKYFKVKYQIEGYSTETYTADYIINDTVNLTGNFIGEEITSLEVGKIYIVNSWLELDDEIENTNSKSIVKSYSFKVFPLTEIEPKFYYTDGYEDTAKELPISTNGTNCKVGCSVIINNSDDYKSYSLTIKKIINNIESGESVTYTPYTGGNPIDITGTISICFYGYTKADVKVERESPLLNVSEESLNIIVKGIYEGMVATNFSIIVVLNEYIGENKYDVDSRRYNIQYSFECESDSTFNKNETIDSCNTGGIENSNNEDNKILGYLIDTSFLNNYKGKITFTVTIEDKVENISSQVSYTVTKLSNKLSDNDIKIIAIDANYNLHDGHEVNDYMVICNSTDYLNNEVTYKVGYIDNGSEVVYGEKEYFSPMLILSSELLNKENIPYMKMLENKSSNSNNWIGTSNFPFEYKEDNVIKNYLTTVSPVPPIIKLNNEEISNNIRIIKLNSVKVSIELDSNHNRTGYAIFIDGVKVENNFNTNNTYEKNIDTVGIHVIDSIYWDNLYPDSSYVHDTYKFILSKYEYTESNENHTKPPLLITSYNSDTNTADCTVKFYDTHSSITHELNIDYSPFNNNGTEDFNQQYPHDIGIVTYKNIDKNCIITAKSISTLNNEYSYTEKTVDFIVEEPYTLDGFQIFGLTERTIDIGETSQKIKIGRHCRIFYPLRPHEIVSIYVNRKFYHEGDDIVNYDTSIKKYVVEIFLTNDQYYPEERLEYREEFYLDTISPAYPSLLNLEEYLMNRVSSKKLPITIKDEVDGIKAINSLTNDVSVDIKTYKITKDDEYLMVVTYTYYDDTKRCSAFRFGINTNPEDNLGPLRTSLKALDKFSDYYTDSSYVYGRTGTENFNGYNSLVHGSNMIDGELIIDRETGHLYMTSVYDDNDETYGALEYNTIKAIPITSDIEASISKLESVIDKIERLHMLTPDFNTAFTEFSSYYEEKLVDLQNDLNELNVTIAGENDSIDSKLNNIGVDTFYDNINDRINTLKDNISTLKTRIKHNGLTTIVVDGETINEGYEFDLNYLYNFEGNSNNFHRLYSEYVNMVKVNLPSLFKNAKATTKETFNIKNEIILSENGNNIVSNKVTLIEFRQWIEKQVQKYNKFAKRLIDENVISLKPNGLAVYVENITTEAGLRQFLNAVDSNLVNKYSDTYNGQTRLWFYSPKISYNYAGGVLHYGKTNS